MKQIPGLFYQANSVAGNMCYARKKQEICKHLRYPMIIDVARWTVFLKLLFQSYEYQKTNVAYIFLEGMS